MPSRKARTAVEPTDPSRPIGRISTVPPERGIYPAARRTGLALPDKSGVPSRVASSAGGTIEMRPGQPDPLFAWPASPLLVINKLHLYERPKRLCFPLNPLLCPALKMEKLV